MAHSRIALESERNKKKRTQDRWIIQTRRNSETNEIEKTYRRIDARGTVLRQHILFEIGNDLLNMQTHEEFYTQVIVFILILKFYKTGHQTSEFSSLDHEHRDNITRNEKVECSSSDPAFYEWKAQRRLR